MKIIDLLNKIANEEEVPKKIKYTSTILYYDDEDSEKNMYNATFNYYDKEGNSALFDGCIGQFLNDEIEIIKEEPRNIEVCGSWFTKSEYDKLAKNNEDKKIRKLDYCEENTFSNMKECTYLSSEERRLLDSNFKTIADKFNEIIDKINSMEE